MPRKGTHADSEKFHRDCLCLLFALGEKIEEIRGKSGRKRIKEKERESTRMCCV